ncbi:hypothetical protein O6H91_07G090800 [Diphasiastrum complanatum]|uniref:Uncharacterized protein n=2 Tax=Diphasiastrum complanatum TaxID=34168 RepID=A0ACC2D7Z2_DIPCM|nr:hypothetical protein O6H91_07G054300 [Diphasiastrum complanatum]KAJ7550253.1 hypothetical protein O6H91_07G090800 [Diphasiastrum complanatum]
MACGRASVELALSWEQKQQFTAPHVVVCAFPAQGHIIPALSFSELLASKGFFVTYVCAEHRLADLRKRIHAAGDKCKIRLAALPDKLPLGQYGIDEGPESLSWSMENVSKMKGDFQQLMGDLMTSSKLTSPTCVISDFFLSWTQDVANQFKIPRYVFFSCPAACLCILMYLPVLIEQGQIPVRTLGNQTNQSCYQTRAIIVPGLPPLSPPDMLYSLKDSCPKDIQEFVIKNSLRIHESAAIFINTYHELEKNAVDALRGEKINPNKIKIHLVGPLLPSDFFREDNLESKRALAYSEEERRCLEWLDKRPKSSVLYVSFGSIAILSVAQIREFALGLEASGQLFLWVLRPPSSHSDISAISSLLPQGFQSRISNHGLILYKWAPQLLILSHPSVGGFLTHCGWNSTLESICRGIPMLAFPQFAEQHLICKILVEQLKVGLQIRKEASGMAERGEIERRVKILMDSDKGRLLRKTAREARERASQNAATTNTSSQSFMQLFLQCHMNLRRCYSS